MTDDNELRQIIADNLKRFREEKGLSQTDLGKVIGKAKTTISTWERGESLPDAAMLYRLATYYDKLIDVMYKKGGQ
jgi:tellurite methyltransferase